MATKIYDYENGYWYYPSYTDEQTGKTSYFNENSGEYEVSNVNTQTNEHSGQQEYWNSATRQWTPYGGGRPPETSAPSLITLDDIKNRTPFSRDPYYGTLIADPNGSSPTDPNEYYKQLGSELAKDSFNISGVNGDSSQYDALIEGLKDVSPQGYYTAKIDVLSRAAGNNYINNEMGRMEIIQNQIKDLLPEAQKAGVTPEQVNQTYQGGFSGGTQLGQQVLANKGGGAFLTPLVEGIKFVGPGLLGMYGIDAALTAGLGAGYGAATGLSSTGIGSGLGTAAELSGALTSGAGSLGAGGLGGAGALSTADILGSTGFTPTAGNSFVIDPTAAYTTAGLGAETLPAESAYENFIQELANTPMDSPIFNPAAEAANSTSFKDILSNANRIRSGANTLAKLLGGGNTTAGTTGATSGATAGTTGGANTQQLASLLALPTQAAPGGLYRMNQNPFNFGTQGQTVASQGMYDVSGTNPMANALRKA